MYDSWNFANNFFCKTCRQRTSKMRLNFTGNTFVFGRKNRENAPRTFFLLAKWKPQKCAQHIFVKFGGGQLKKRIWTSWQTALIWDAKIEKMHPELLYKPCKRRIPKMRLKFLYAVSWERLQSWKYVPYIFAKYLNCVLWNFLQWRKSRPKMQVPIFKIFVGWHPKKVPKVPFFSVLREHCWEIPNFTTFGPPTKNFWKSLVAPLGKILLTPMALGFTFYVCYVSTKPTALSSCTTVTLHVVID